MDGFVINQGTLFFRMMALSTGGLHAARNEMQAILPAGMGCPFLYDAEGAGTYWNARSEPGVD